MGLFCCVLWGALSFACSIEREEIDDNPSQSLFFSEDVLQFDTLISGVQSPSKGLRLHNPNKRAVTLREIRLERDLDSPFMCWIGGQRGRSFQDIRVLGEDSIFILVEAQARSQNQRDLREEEDRLLVEYGSDQHHLAIRMWSQDVVYGDTLVIDRDTDWRDQVSRHIGVELRILPHATLYLGPGMHLFFSPGARMYVEGRLEAIGTSEKPVVFTSHRQDGDYKEAPGQWKGIILASVEEQHTIIHASICNADIGLSLGTTAQIESAGFLRLGNTQIFNMSTGALLTYGGNTFIYNTVMYNAQYYLAKHYGGTHRYLHCTMSSYSTPFFNVAQPLQLSDHLSTATSDQSSRLLLQMENSILWSSLEESIQLTKKHPQTEIYITHTLVRSSSGSHLDEHSVWDAEDINFPRFVDPRDHNYKLDRDSPALGAGKSLNIPEQLQDLEGNSRGTGYDLGAYERHFK